VIHHLDEYFHRKYEEDENGKLVRVATPDEVKSHNVDDAQAHHALEHMHMPSPSYWPFVLAVGLPLIGYGIMFHYAIAFVGGLIVVGAMYGWALEPSVDDGGHGGGELPDPTRTPDQPGTEPHGEEAVPVG
jgi:cytochrome c oxidase subunit 1